MQPPLQGQQVAAPSDKSVLRRVGQLAQPLIIPTGEEREGYVPNVVYSCGALIHAGRLIIPYAMADSATSFACVEVDELLAHLLP